MISDLEFKLRVLRGELVSAARGLHYKMTVPKQKHRAATERAEIFAGDFMAYLNEPAVWAKLNLDHSQNGVLNTLIEAAKTGNLHL